MNYKVNIKLICSNVKKNLSKIKNNFKLRHYPGVALELVPENLMTEEICKLAVMENRKALKFVPDEFMKLFYFKNFPQTRMEYDLTEVRALIENRKIKQNHLL